MAQAEKRYTVMVNENSHYQDESERYKHGDFGSCEEALAACRKIVDDFLVAEFKKGTGFKELWTRYTLFGEDPSIVCPDKSCSFSAWDYAKKRCAELCGEGP